jgi:hypothetical protein
MLQKIRICNFKTCEERREIIQKLINSISASCTPNAKHDFTVYVWCLDVWGLDVWLWGLMSDVWCLFF